MLELPGTTAACSAWLNSTNSSSSEQDAIQAQTQTTTFRGEASAEETRGLDPKMSNYRDTVREMMRDFKANKAVESPALEAPVETIEADVPDEEELLDDILDLEEGGPVSEAIVNEDEADRLLASSPTENADENNGKDLLELNARAEMFSSPLFMLCKQNRM